MTIRRFTGAAATFAAIALVTAGCSGTTPTTSSDVQDPELAALIEQAQQEGELAFYQVNDERTAQAIAAAFQDEYGIATTYSRLPQSDLIQRFSAEAEAGAPGADVVLPLYGQGYEGLVSADFTVPLGDADIPGYPSPDLPQTSIYDTTASISSMPFAFGYNSDEVQSDDVPRTWPQLLDSRWTAEVIRPTWESSPETQVLWNLVAEEYGVGMLEEFGGQVSRSYASAVPTAEALAAGEGQIAVPGVPAILGPMGASGAPVAWQVPEDVSLAADTVVALSADAAHPYSARLFAHWLLSAEGTALFNDSDGPLTPREAEEEGVTHLTLELQQDAATNAERNRTALGF